MSGELKVWTVGEPMSSMLRAQPELVRELFHDPLRDTLERGQVLRAEFQDESGRPLGGFDVEGAR